MFAIRDPRTLFRYTAIFAYILVGLDVLNIINAVNTGDNKTLVVCIITASVALVCGFVFYIFSVLSLVNVIKFKNLLWIPAILLFFSDTFCAIFAIVSIVRFNQFVKILALRQQQMGNTEIFVNRNINKNVINVDCTVLEPKQTEEEFNVKLKKLDALKDAGSIDDDEYRTLRQKLIDEYLR